MPPMPTVTSLDAEWTQLRAHVFSQGPFAGCTAGAVLGSISSNADGVLLALVGAAVGGDQLAGRTVVQALIGKLVRMAVADQRLSFDDLLAALWVRLGSYPVDRRRRSVAANLVLDARKDVLAEQRGLRPVAPAEPEGPDDTPTAAGVLDAAYGMGLIDRTSRAILGSVYDEGLASAAAAKRHGTTATAVRWRCSRDVRRMAARSAELRTAVA